MNLFHLRYFETLVLRTAPLKFPTPTTDRDRTVSRRSEPSSRTALMGEQPNPWDLLQPQDAMSRHRGARLLVWLQRKTSLQRWVSCMAAEMVPFTLTSLLHLLQYLVCPSWYSTCCVHRASLQWVQSSGK